MESEKIKLTKVTVSKDEDILIYKQKRLKLKDEVEEHGSQDQGIPGQGDNEENEERSSCTMKKKGNTVTDHNYFGPKGKPIKVVGKKRQSKTNENSDSCPIQKKRKRKQQVPTMVKELNDSPITVKTKKRTFNKRRANVSSRQPEKPFKCEMCGSSFVTDPLRRATKVNKSGYLARPRYKIDPVSKEKIVLCNACGLKFGRSKKGRKTKPQPSDEDKDKFLEEGQTFAENLYNELRDEDALQLHCPYFKRGACGCIQKFIMKDETLENIHVRANQLLKLIKRSKELRQLKHSSKENGEKRSAKGKKAPAPATPKTGRRKSEKFEAFVLAERETLRQDFSFCERGTQRILLYSNNFLHKRRKAEPEGPSRIQQQKGLDTQRNLKPVEELADQRCCLDNCVRMARSHKLLLQQWRDRARSGQAEARRVLAEMLTPSGGSRTNCYKFIGKVTGCCPTTISKVNEQMKKTGGNREPPQHGLIKWWKDHPRPKKPKEEKPSKQAMDANNPHAQDMTPLFPAAAFVQPLSIIQAAANTSGLTAVIQPQTTQQAEQTNQHDGTQQSAQNGGATIVNLGGLNCTFPQSFISIPTGLGLTNAFSIPANTFQLQQQLQQQQLQHQIQQLQLQLLQHQQQQQQQQQHQQPQVFAVAFQNPTSSTSVVPSMVSSANTNTALIATPAVNVHTTDSIHDTGLAMVSTHEHQPHHSIPSTTAPQTSTSLPAQVIIAGSNQTSPIILTQTSQGLLTMPSQPVAVNHSSNTNISGTVSMTPSFAAEGFLNSEAFSVISNENTIAHLPSTGIGQLTQIGQNTQVDQTTNLQPAVQVSYIASN